VCLFPRRLPNRKYIKNQKNGGVIPPIPDERVRYVNIGCENCIECRKKKARAWKVRMMEDIKINKNAKFVTFTFSNEKLKELYEMKASKRNKDISHLKGYDLDNALAKRGVKLFLERYRKEHKVSLRHWLVTELGHQGTENIHLHGIVWADDMNSVEKHWGCFIWKGYEIRGKLQNYVNEKTINYIVGYVSKIDPKHKHYKSIVLCSPGIGKNYIDSVNCKNNKYNGLKTDQSYTTRTGNKLNLPAYWRNKIYSDEERERMWIDSLDSGKVYIMGETTKAGEEEEKLRKYYQKINARLGYRGYTNNKDELEHENKIRELLLEKRLRDLPRAPPSGGPSPGGQDLDIIRET